MYKVWIWGCALFYESIRNTLLLEESKGSITIEGIIVSERPCYKQIDGKTVFLAEEWILKNVNYDYIIVASNSFQDIKNYAIALGVLEDRIIWGGALRLSTFDFERYISIVQKKISIVAESCFGGRLYHTLGMKFYSPFINIRMYEEDYFICVENIQIALRNPITECKEEKVCVCNSNIKDQMYVGVPKAYLDCGDGKKAIVNFVHGQSYEEERKKWELRKTRFNFENYFIMMVLNNDEQIDKFLSISSKNKIGFSYKNVSSQHIVYLKEWEACKAMYHYDFRQYVHDFVSGQGKVLPSVDLLKLLNGEEYYRIE